MDTDDGGEKPQITQIGADGSLRLPIISAILANA